jgi:hypothetical protein
LNLPQQKNKQKHLSIGWMIQQLKSDFDELHDEQKHGYEYLQYFLLV